MSITQTEQPLQGPELQLTGVSVQPAPASFRQRAAAFCYDLFFLGAIFSLLAMLASTQLASGPFSNSLLYLLGYFDRLISATLALAYFCLDGLGGTPGKRLWNLSVRDLNGAPLRFPRALLRSAIVALVFLYFGRSLAVHLENALILGLVGAMVYLLAVNRKAGQSLQDVLAGTRVIHNHDSTTYAYPVTPRWHLITAGVILALPMLLWGIRLTVANLNAPLASPWQVGLSKSVLRDPRYLDLQMQDARVSVTLNPWYKQSYELGVVPHAPTQEVKAYLATQGYNSNQVVVQTVEVLDLGFFKWVTIATPITEHSSYIVTYEWTLFGLFSTSISTGII